MEQQGQFSPIEDWIPESEFLARYPHIAAPTLRWQLTNRRNNGLAPHVQLIGRRRYISLKGYGLWLTLRAQAGHSFGSKIGDHHDV